VLKSGFAKVDSNWTYCCMYYRVWPNVTSASQSLHKSRSQGALSETRPQSQYTA